MPDFNRCISALNKAAGRELDADELQGIFQRIQKTAGDLKAGRIQDAGGPQNLASTEGLIRRAAEIEAQSMIAEADRKSRNAIQDAKIVATRQAEMMEMRKAPNISAVDAVRRLLVNDADGRADQFSLEARSIGVSQYLKTRIQDTWAAMDRSFMEYLSREDKIGLLVREIRGEDTGDAMAKKGADVWRKTSEDARQWFNSRGGNIGRLDDWGMPQHHSQELVAKAGRDEWIAFVMPRLDRSRYVDLSGNPMSDAEVSRFLSRAWDTIATNGASKLEPGRARGVGGRANRHAEERQVHFRDAQSTIDYWGRFGEKTVPDILMGHIETMANDIAFIEHFGTNPESTYRMLRDMAGKAAKEADPTKLDKVDGELAKLDRIWDYASGKVKPVASRSIARGFDVVRNLNTAGKLGSAVWASVIGDKVLFEAIGRINNLPDFQRWHNEIRLLNPANQAERQMLRRHGLMLDYMTNALHRFGDELGKSSLTGRLANSVMRVSGMSAANDWRRGAWALTAMDTLGHIVGTKKFSDVGSQDMRLLNSYGINEFDWKVWGLAKLDDLGNGNDTALTAEAVGRITDNELKAADLISQGDDGTEAARVRTDASIKLLGAVTSESRLAVLEPGWQDRARMYGGLQRGDLRDELTRSFWQFKAFPIAQFERILDVGMSRPTTGGKASFLLMVPVLQTLAGGMLIQVQELLAGKDPRPMDDWKFWAAAFLKGGSLGLYGDFLFSQSGTTRYGTGPLEAIAGPTIGGVADLATFIAQAPGKIASGDDPQVAAKALNIAKGYIPFQNLWFTKAATDHIIFQNAQEALNPGYLDSMRARTQREFGNDWWWAPGEATPDRAPDLGNAFGDP
jgi:hypothetical protein